MNKWGNDMMYVQTIGTDNTSYYFHLVYFDHGFIS